MASAYVMSKVRNALERRGWTLTQWARENGFNENSVYVFLKRWSGRNRRPRSGFLTQKVIEALERDTEVRICGH